MSNEFGFRGASANWNERWFYDPNYMANSDCDASIIIVSVRYTRLHSFDVVSWLLSCWFVVLMEAPTECVCVCVSLYYMSLPFAAVFRLRYLPPICAKPIWNGIRQSQRRVVMVAGAALDSCALNQFAKHVPPRAKTQIRFHCNHTHHIHTQLFRIINTRHAHHHHHHHIALRCAYFRKR